MLYDEIKKPIEKKEIKEEAKEETKMEYIDYSSDYIKLTNRAKED